MNYIISNDFESQSDIDYTLVIRAMNIWQLKQSAIDKAIDTGSQEGFGEIKQIPLFCCMT